jgi:hypothetical protein
MGCINGRVRGMSCVRVLWANRRGKRRRIAGKKRFKIFFFPASACAGERSSTVPFKTAPCSFFWKKMKINLGVTQKWVMTVSIKEKLFKLSIEFLGRVHCFHPPPGIMSIVFDRPQLSPQDLCHMCAVIILLGWDGQE